MSELQTALLAIGVVVIVAVYAFGWWQQKQYQRKFGVTLKNEQSDPLYQPTMPKVAEHQPIFPITVDEPHIAGPAHEPPYEPIIKMEPEVVHTEVASAPIAPATPEPQTAPSKTEDAHALLSPYSDFIVELRLAEPSHASALAGFWQRKFDFGKNVQVFGLTLAPQPRDNSMDSSAVQPLEEHWEKVLAESPALYVVFRVALQMVDRGGAIGVAKLADFRDLLSGLAQKIKAEVDAPDIHQAHNYAVQLDGYCAAVDQLVGINLLPAGDRLLPGKRIAQAAAAYGLTLESDGAFHMLDGHGHSLFSMVNQNNEAFPYYDMDNATSAGLTLLLDVPRTVMPSEQFVRMVQIAQALAKDLQANMVDDHMVVLNDAALERIYDQICNVEDTMQQSSMTPGSAQARRLFV